MSRLDLGLGLGVFFFVATASSAALMGGCSNDDRATDDNGGASDESALTHKPRDAWFYDGPLPALENPQLTVSLKGHTVRVSGVLPANTTVPADLPHLKSKPEGGDAAGRTHVDIVYPIATGAESGFNASPGDYTFSHGRPYRPDGNTTSSRGTSFVTWGGFPFLAYNNSIALHGPITRQDNESRTDDDDVFYLRRGTVSHGCNRMNGEHVVELAHLVGVNMRKVWVADAVYNSPSTNHATVTVIRGYDSYDGKLVDVDYATDTGMVRPPADQSIMFGSWAATETPDGSDLPSSMKWEAGIVGKLYVFKEHVRADTTVCSVAESRIPALRSFASTLPGASLPRGFCAKKTCILGALKAGGDPKTTCQL